MVSVALTVALATAATSTATTTYYTSCSTIQSARLERLDIHDVGRRCRETGSVLTKFRLVSGSGVCPETTQGRFEYACHAGTIDGTQSSALYTACAPVDGGLDSLGQHEATCDKGSALISFQLRRDGCPSGSGRLKYYCRTDSAGLFARTVSGATSCHEVSYQSIDALEAHTVDCGADGGVAISGFRLTAEDCERPPPPSPLGLTPCGDGLSVDYVGSSMDEDVHGLAAGSDERQAGCFQCAEALTWAGQLCAGWSCELRADKTFLRRDGRPCPQYGRLRYACAVPPPPPLPPPPSPTSAGTFNAISGWGSELPTTVSKFNGGARTSGGQIVFAPADAETVMVYDVPSDTLRQVDGSRMHMHMHMHAHAHAHAPLARGSGRWTSAARCWSPAKLLGLRARRPRAMGW